MIFVSTANVRHERIGDSVLALAEAGFKNIELSGGTRFYSKWKTDLLELRDRFDLNFRVHNYFPPPEKPFVLNLASADKTIVEKSHHLIRDAVDLSGELGAKSYGFHAGFRINPSAGELGGAILSRGMISYQEAHQKFVEEFKKAEEYSRSKEIDLFVENNVLSAQNYQRFGQQNPFLLTTSREYFEMKSTHNFNLLLDVAHLKVSTQTLGLDFALELKSLCECSNYLHLSDNDGLADSNLEISNSSELHRLLSGFDLSGKFITLEVADSIEGLKRTYEGIEKLVRVESHV